MVSFSQTSHRNLSLLSCRTREERSSPLYSFWSGGMLAAQVWSNGRPLEPIAADSTRNGEAIDTCRRRLTFLAITCEHAPCIPAIF